MPTAVLHVDDDPAFLELSAASFAHLDDSIALTTASNATDAAELLETNTYDCIVSDYVTAPDGTAFVRSVGERYPDLPLIMLSGKELEHLPDPTVQNYLTDFVQKGSSEVFDDLVTRIRLHLEPTESKPAPSMREVFLKNATVNDTAIRLLDLDDEPTYGLLEAVADLRDIDVTELPPLFRTLDADLLEALFAQSRDVGDAIELRFRYAGFDLLLNSDGTLFLRDMAASYNRN